MTRPFLFLTQALRLFEPQTKPDGVFNVYVFGKKMCMTFQEILLE